MELIYSKDYFKNVKNKIYQNIVVKSKEDINSMIEYFNYFDKIANFKDKNAGLDFEFNSSPDGKKIALFQINLQSEEEKARIYLFYPPDLNVDQINILIELLTNINIKKILHGAESLDIPYLFKNIFTTNELRNSFTMNLFDTRYLCEYYHIEMNKENEKCKIYSLLRELNVINDNQYDMLIKNEEEMGPIYLIDIDVRNLSSNTMLYSAFDVLYLPDLLSKFPKNDIYLKLIPEITCFNYIDRYEDIFVKPMSELVNKANNYFMRFEEENLKLIDIYGMYYYWVSDDTKILQRLMNINYFKKFIEVFIKFITYKTILKNYTIYENVNNITNIYDQFVIEENKFKKIKLGKDFEEFFSNIRRAIKNDIDAMN